jgi:DNA end-binding protein Ku
MRAKEYLVAVRVREGVLSLTTMRFHDEVRPTGDIPTGGKKPSRRAVDQAVAIIEELSTDWNPKSYTDCYRERLKRVIDSKRKGKRIHPPQLEKEPVPVPDLMEAPERTLANVERGRSPRDAGDDGAELDDLSRAELYERAQNAGIPGRSKMSREELAEALGAGKRSR